MDPIVIAALVTNIVMPIVYILVKVFKRFRSKCCGAEVEVEHDGSPEMGR